MVKVPRDIPKSNGTPLTAEDWVDTATDAIRQETVVIRLEFVKYEIIPDKGDKIYLQLYLRLFNAGHDKAIPLEGFGAEKVTLKDDGGHVYPLVEVRPRKQLANAPPTFVAGPPESVVIPTRYVDQLLIFEAPPTQPAVPLRLELNAALWGRKGTAKLLISKYFDLP
jgi:hypothetical protein